MLEATLDRHPHARAVLGAALTGGESASHAYLFHGPAGAGKRATAAAFAAHLLSGPGDDIEGVHRRVTDRVHPDCAWVAPSGAALMIRSDIDEPVVSAATRTPFEATRRVFVIERADTMNDEAANRLLKTLEEPPSFVHLILLTNRPAAMLETIVSRCQPVRFEAATRAELATTIRAHGIPERTADACARLSLGDGEFALRLALGDGETVRAAAQTFSRAVIAGELRAAAPGDLVEQAARDEKRAVEAAVARFEAEAEVLGERERKRHVRDGETAAKRAGRRAKTQTIDDGLRLISLWLRDVAVCADAEPGLIRNSDRADLIAADAERVDPVRARAAVALVEKSRTTLVLNPSEELLLDALASRVERVLNG